ncbi:phytanoyl-CoA dioxygenase [Endozoicomonas sp. OPT23]|uniref:phytanoyl-CoA dioxygenase family protein n=1 Tax=Endozoicomonas sp. OPT23 TaxID=2072845 RepID=UPI00129B1B6C|nr:phytanoyl-CoA dioxygenase family protein [Endozoicomonas sp. OPT23]MRI34412.1 phytanoyl-CoA dioxygenase [Endozoicomonas sp. OPT23]
MSHFLSTQQIAQYQTEGCLFPLTVFSSEEAASLRSQLESMESRQGHVMDRGQCNKTYLLYDWADEIVHHPKILDAVESLIGPDILCYMSNLFTKEAGSESFVSMHQDAAYWGVEADDVVTAWVALSPATPESGVMKVELGSHKSIRPQTNTYEKNNLLTRGQKISASDIDVSKTVYMTLEPGQMSLHHFMLVHGSNANTSEDRRIGLAIRYVAASARKIGQPESALLVRGNSQGFFLPEKRAIELSESERKRQHAQALRRQIRNVFEPSDDAGFRERARLATTKRLAILLSYYKELRA